MIHRFIDYLSLELNYSPNTATAYRTDLLQWAEWATDGRPDELKPMDVTVSDLRLYMSWLGRNGVSVATMKRKVQALKSFYKFLMRNHGLKSNPAAALSTPRLPKRLPLNVRPEETAAMLDAGSDVYSSLNEFKNVRDRLIGELLYDTGMRCSELTGLLDVNTDTRRRELKVHGKRNKDRIIPISPRLAEMIESYRPMRPAPEGADRPVDTLLVSVNGYPLSRHDVYRIMRRCMEAADVHAARRSPHVMRHSMATDMLNAGAGLNTVKQILGHASLASTQVYTHLSIRELQQNYQQAHPRALKKGGQNGH
ncbi:MAG: tyrosine-type recombinase/integrase [Bacteroides sp.]|nr:tyrosine-type recombinase/integrase [Bacteroidales bacterium]MBD5252896.1 tyrosine-type recombinase/integrase [Barnesiella sp.]MBD5368376.1 tyrosine-type recombinase/integrase [Bacteroides sp.]MDE5828663.1 tyrosine-type recombinase/integrase [Duncaniella sp.]